MSDRILEEARIRWLAQPEAKIVLEAALNERPLLRGMKPDKPMDQQAQQMLWDSAARHGFDKLMTFLRGNTEWQNKLK